MVIVIKKKSSHTSHLSETESAPPADLPRIDEAAAPPMRLLALVGATVSPEKGFEQTVTPVVVRSND